MKIRPATAWTTAPTISPSCAIWLSMSCARTTPRPPCGASSNSPDGRTTTLPASSPNSEVRLPWRRGRFAQGLIDRGEHLAHRKFIEATAVTVDMVFAAKLVAGHARQRILHHPNIAPALKSPGTGPGPRQPADRPRTHQARACRPVERDRLRPRGGGEMGHGR